MCAKTLLALAVSVYVSGCIPKQEEPQVSAPSVSPVSVVEPSPAALPIAAPPPNRSEGAPATPVSKPGQAAVPAQDFSNFTDENGSKLTELQILSTAVDAYEQSRFTVVLNEDDEPWPPLTNLTQLVTYKLLPRLPAAPAGKQWIFSPETKKVALK